MQSLNLLSYNIFMRPPGIKNNKDDFKDERLDLIIQNVLPIFDIICFQEMFGLLSNRKAQLIKKAQKQGFYVLISKNPFLQLNKFVLDSGLVIMSKFPIINEDFQAYRIGNHVDQYCQKGVLYSKIALSNELNLLLFNTHTQATYPKSKLESFESRDKQIQELAKFIYDHLLLEKEKTESEQDFKQHNLCILAGDFNVDYNEEKFPTQVLQKLQQNSIQETNEYQILLKNLQYDKENNKKLNVIDLVRQASTSKIITFGDGTKEEPLEKALTLHIDYGSQQQLDYIFQVELEDNINQQFSSNERNLRKEQQKLYQIDHNMAQVEKFQIKEMGKTLQFTQLSDHYGISCQIKFYPNLENTNGTILQQNQKSCKQKNCLIF